jgi:hypothetical protein
MLMALASLEIRRRCPKRTQGRGWGNDPDFGLYHIFLLIFKNFSADILWPKREVKCHGYA